MDVCLSLITRLAHQMIFLTYKKLKKIGFCCLFFIKNSVVQTFVITIEKKQDLQRITTALISYLNKLLQHYPHLTL